jgi:GNAT superfamily N-acetyltransferase
MQVIPSKIDSDRFGVPTVKCLLAPCDSVKDVLDRSVALGAGLAILRVPVELHDHVRELESAGSILCDTLVYTGRNITSEVAPDPGGGLVIRDANPSDATEVAQVASEAFHRYDSHYRNDPRLRSEDVDQIYPSWAANCCTNPNVADKVLLVEAEGKVIAFGALKKLEAGCLDGVLFGVLPEYRGRGLLVSLIRHSMAWGIQEGCNKMEYSTHLTNIGALKVLTKLGFSIDHCVHTFHKWF